MEIFGFNAKYFVLVVSVSTIKMGVKGLWSYLEPAARQMSSTELEGIKGNAHTIPLTEKGESNIVLIYIDV